MSANDNFSLHDDEELSLHDDASLDGSIMESEGDLQNGNSKKRVTKGKDGVYRVLPPTTQEEQFADEKERKARTLLLMAVPKDHLRRFHGMDDAKEIWAAIKTRFGGNANSKKMQKAVLKQQFEAFTISSKESLEKGYDRFQKLLSQLDALGAGVSDEDANHKFLRSLPPAWDSLAMTMRTKKNIDTLSIDDLYNNLSVFEQDIQKTSSSSITSDNVAFLSQAKASSSKHKPSHSSGSYSSYTTSSSKATTTATPGLADETLDQIDDLDLEEMDINWQIAMTAIKIKKFYKKTGRRPRVDGKMHVAFDKRKVECFNCHNTGHFARECKFKGSKEGNRQEAGKGQNFKPVQIEKEALMTIDEGQINWVEQTTDEELNHALMAFTVNNEVSMCSKLCLDSYNALQAKKWQGKQLLRAKGFHAIFASTPLRLTLTRAHLEDYQELSKVGSVTFGGSKGSISGKGTIRLGNLVFDDVAFVKELGHFNLFSISQICDKKLNVLLKVPRQHNMYTFDMKNVDSSKGYTCLLAKASSDEAKLWHRSKAFRVLYFRHQKSEVNLHVNFLEEKPNVQGIGHRWMFDLDYLTDSMNYIPVSLQNQANPAGSKEVIDIDVQTKEDADLMVVSSTSLAEATRKAAVSEKIAKKKTHSPKKPSSTPISKSADDIMTFRKELDALALKHLGPVPATAPTSTNPVNTGSDNLNTVFEEVTPGNIEAISPSADHEEEVFSDADDDEMPEIRIYDKSSEGIFEQASYDDDGILQNSTIYRKSQTPLKMEAGLKLKQEEQLQFKHQQFYSQANKYASSSLKTTSRPDIMYAVCACSRFQVTLKVSHLYAVKRIFKYIKRKPKLGLWYPRESLLDLVAYSDSDYAAANLDRKSTTGGCQFLGRRLISWQCKKQTIVATSTTEAEYVAAASCCGQVLWLQNQLLDYGFNFMNTIIHIDNQSTICIIKNPVYHSKTKHIEIRHHFIRDCYEKKLIQVQKIHTDLNVADLLTKAFDGPRYYLELERSLHVQLGHENGHASYHLLIGCKLVHNQVGFLLKPAESAGYTEIVDFLRRSKLRYALTHNPPIYDSLVKQFWQTATARTLADGTQQLNATIDSIEYTITEESVRRQLQLADASGINMLQNEEIFAGLQNIGSKSGGWDQFGSNIATALICLSTGRDFNFSKLIFDGMISNLKSKSKFLMYPRFLQMILNIQTENKNLFVPVLLTKKIFGNMKRGFQGIHRPLLPAMLTIDAGQAQPSAAPTPSHVQIPTPPTISTPPPILTPTPPPIPTPTSPPPPPPILTPTPPPIPTPTSPPPPPETEPTTDEHIYEEQSPVHHHFSPSQEQATSHMPMDDLLQAVPKLISRIDSLEMDLKQTKLTMGNAIVKLVKKVKKLEGFMKRRNLVLTDSEEEEPEAQEKKSQGDSQDFSVQGLVTPPTTKVNTSGEEQVEEISPNTLEAAKTLSKVASLKSRSVDKGRRYKRRKETKSKKVVSSLDFQEEVDAGTEQVNTAGEVNTAEQVNTAGEVNTAEQVNTAGEEVNTASEVNTGSIKVNTGIEQVSAVGKDKGQREGKGRKDPMTEGRPVSRSSSIKKSQRASRASRFLYERYKKQDQTFVAIGSEEDERAIKRMNEQAADKEKEQKDESVHEEVKEEEGAKKRKLGTRRKLKAKRRKYTSSLTREDDDLKGKNVVLYNSFTE
ncbi:putative ribonuclease H-like domain-containing protein [Tanacetum coccineum]